MINLNLYKKRDLFEVHKEIILSKRDYDLVNHLVSLDSVVLSQFNIHKNETSTNTLEKIAALSIADESANRLRCLYSYKSPIIIKLKQELMTGKNGRIISECQYCSINSVNSIDHVMPKNIYPEFSVNFQNLFPCCSECNSYKTNKWVLDDKREFLNLYLDKLPRERYLFVNIKYKNDIINYDFYLDNKNGISSDLYELISKHYSNLKLLSRFKMSSESVVSSIKNTLTSLPDNFGYEKTKKFIKEIQDKEMEKNGYNFWKSVLILELIENDDFLNDCNIY